MNILEPTPADRIRAASACLERRGFVYLAAGETARACRAFRAADRLVFRHLTRPRR